MKRRVFAMFLAVALVFALAACTGGKEGGKEPAANNGEKVVRIGVFEPSTGDSGPGGKQEMLGMQYANKETPTVEIGGETYKVDWSTPITAPIPPRRPLLPLSWWARTWPLFSVPTAPACPWPAAPCLKRTGLPPLA